MTLANMWIAAGTNNLRASQARISANNLKAQVETLFEADYALEVDYHSLLDGNAISLFEPCRELIPIFYV